MDTKLSHTCRDCGSLESTENPFPREDTPRCEPCHRAAARSATRRYREKLKGRAEVPATPQAKTCATCKSSKVAEHFGKCRASLDGLQYDCKMCQRTASRARYAADLETSRAYSKERAARRRVRSPEKVREARLRWAHGVGVEVYNTFLEKQGGVCAVCKQAETNKFKGKVRDLCLDHDHTTGKKRGLLCVRCNRALGLLRDDPSVVRNMLEYISEHMSQNQD